MIDDISNAFNLASNSIAQLSIKGEGSTNKFLMVETFRDASTSRSKETYLFIKTASQLEKPRFMITYFQTNEKLDNTKKASKYNNCKISGLKVILNSQYYPYNNLNLNLGKNQFLGLYHSYIDFYNAYYGTSESPSLLLSHEQFRGSPPRLTPVLRPTVA